MSKKFTAPFASTDRIIDKTQTHIIASFNMSASFKLSRAKRNHWRQEQKLLATTSLKDLIK